MRVDFSAFKSLKYESGFARIDPKQMFEIARLFDVPVTAFFEGLL